MDVAFSSQLPSNWFSYVSVILTCDALHWIEGALTTDNLGMSLKLYPQTDQHAFCARWFRLVVSEEKQGRKGPNTTLGEYKNG